MRLRYFFVRAAAGTLAIGSAAPVNLPYEMQALENALSANAVVPVRPVDAYRPPVPRDARIADADGLRGDKRLLKIGKNGDLPCDSGEWATSGLFGPHAGLLAALGVRPSGTENGARDVALAAALDDRPATGDADSSAFGSVFGNASHPPPGAGGGDLFNPGTGTGTATTGGTGGGAGGIGGTVIVGGGTDTGGGTGTGTDGGPFSGGGTGPTGGTGGGPGKGGGTGGTGSGGGTGYAGGGTTGGGAAGGTAGTGWGTDASGPSGGAIGGSTSGGDSGANGGGSPGSIGDTGHFGTTGGTENPPPLDTILPTDSSSGDHPGSASTGGSTATQPDGPAAAPEPASWMMMLAGFGLVGGAMRSRRRKPGLA